MALDRHNRNYNGVRWSELRLKIDPIFTDIMDDLEDCYYGSYTSETTPRLQDGWKHGQSKPWLGIVDVQTTPELSKQQFDLFHGVMNHLYTILFDKVNQEEPLPIPTTEYDEEIDRDNVTHSKLTTARSWIQTTLQDAGNDLDLPKLNTIRNALIARVQSDLGYTIDLS